MGEALMRREAKTIEHGTPRELFKELDEEFGFSLDAAATAENALCSQYFTAEDDGTAQSWADHVVFCNPPYSVKWLGRFTAKALEEARKGVFSVLLLPCKTDQQWFHDLWAWYQRWVEGTLKAGEPWVEFRWIKGRLRFEGNQDSAGFPSMIVVVGQWEGDE
jgi:site-specific DNA-methyltransferase (adenine-specific)